MADTILVTPEKLKNTAEEFRGLGIEVRNLTQEMVSLVDGLGTIHEGEVATAYHDQFHRLDKDMEIMHNRIIKHVTHLNEVADRFVNTTGTLTSEAAGLPTDTCSTS